MSIDHKVTFVRIKGCKEATSYQVCSIFFYNGDNLTKVKLLIFDLASEAAFKVRLSGQTLSEKEAVVTKAFSTSADDEFEILIDRSLSTLALTFRGEFVLKNVPFSVENFADLRRKMFELAVVDNDANVAKLKKVLERQSELQSEVEVLRNSLKQVVDEKLGIEKSMIGKFLPILKAKDEKIAELVRTCHELASKLHSVSSSSSSADEGSDGDNNNLETADANASLSIL